MANFCPELIFHYGGKFNELTHENNIETTFITGIHGQTDKIRRFIAMQAFLSQRQFERNFKELIGFSPKFFARLVRFKSLINNYKKEINH